MLKWSVNNTVTSVKRIFENQNNIYNVELNNGVMEYREFVRNPKTVYDTRDIQNGRFY